MNSNAKAIYEAREQAERQHHLARVLWLSGERPTWACGTPVEKYEVRSMLQQSESFLARA